MFCDCRFDTGLDRYGRALNIICAHEGCNFKPWPETGYCKHHDPNKEVRTCSVEGCERKHNCQGFCRKHYMTWRLKNDPEFAEATKKRKREAYARKTASAT